MIIIISCIANKPEKNILYGEMNKFDEKKKIVQRVLPGK